MHHSDFIKRSEQAVSLCHEVSSTMEHMSKEEQGKVRGADHRKKEKQKQRQKLLLSSDYCLIRRSIDSEVFETGRVRNRRRITPSYAKPGASILPSKIKLERN